MPPLSRLVWTAEAQRAARAVRDDATDPLVKASARDFAMIPAGLTLSTTRAEILEDLLGILGASPAAMALRIAIDTMHAIAHAKEA